MSQKQIDRINNRLDAIEKRNQKVDSNKRWETSKIRIISIAILTYISMVVLFFQIGSINPFVSAIVPTMGFVLSTLSLSWIRKIVK
jgi:hypothetical protein